MVTYTSINARRFIWTLPRKFSKMTTTGLVINLPIGLYIKTIYSLKQSGALGVNPGAPSLHSHALTKYATINGLCYSLPLNSARRLGGAVEHHAVDLGDGVGDAGGDAR